MVLQPSQFLAISTFSVLAVACGGTAERNETRAPAVAASAADSGEARDFTLWEWPARTPGDLEFKQLQDLVPGGSVQLDDGQIVDAADWPATLVAGLSGGGYCTASLVGPRALLTAAHCVDLGKAPGSPGPLAGGGNVEIKNRVYSLTKCEMDPSYSSALKVGNSPRSSTDYALCVLSAAVPAADARPESISTAALGVGSPLLLAGYGCTNIVIRPINGRDQLTYTSGDGKLRMGDERISYVGDKAGNEAVGVWLTTQDDGGEPTLCPGDSGGPVLQGATVGDQRRSRRVIGVNSAVGWAKLPNGTYRYFSFLSPLGTDSFKRFLTDFTNRNKNADGTKLAVCGFNQNPGIGGCRA